MPDIKVPAFPESIEEGQILAWHKQKGESFARDELLVEVETDKVVMEVPAPSAGVLTEIKVDEGVIVKANQVIGNYEVSDNAPQKTESKPQKTESKPQETESKPQKTESKSQKTQEESRRQETQSESSQSSEEPQLKGENIKSSPAARRFARASGVDLSSVKTKGRVITKQDVTLSAGVHSQERRQERAPMSRLRASIAKRLVQSQQTAAMLTTFNEVNMRAVINLRADHKREFEQKHGVRLGFMSFFARASVYGLSKFPEVNAYIEGDDIVYHNYNDIGIAVSSPRGLVVPVLRDVQSMGLASIEKQIAELVEKASAAKLSLEELQGGTFTISNGGVFGSLMSTPIINPPQTAILGMHKIQERPVAVEGEVQVLPMMYLALSYDHRMIDGKMAVQFLVAIKEFLEYPGLELLEL